MSKYHTKKGKTEQLTNRPLPPKRKTNAEVRPREHLTPNEVRKLLDAARGRGRYGDRDALAMLMTYRHALRAGELVDMKWEQIDFVKGVIHVNREKDGDSSTHFVESDEMRILKALRKDSESPYIFVGERGLPWTIRNFHKLVALAGKAAGFDMPIHPHMLRHSKGYQLANGGIDTRAIQEYMGHKNIQSTAIYTRLNANRFKNFGRDDLR